MSLKGGVSCQRVGIHRRRAFGFNVNQGTLTQLTHKDTAADMAPSRSRIGKGVVLSKDGAAA